MNNPPQAVTSRYVSNLLTIGHNDTFTLFKVDAEPTMINGVNIGTHYEVSVGCDFHVEPTVGIGATPLAAVTHALLRLGVTFR